ncbi:MAG: Bug family tripartite tricarboxylate transporter substrate binding protein [Cupriavidus necator]
MQVRFPRAFACACAMQAAAVLGTAGPASAESFPSRPISVKVAYSAGGGADVATRQLAAPLQRAIGKAVVVENLPGAGGSVATMAYFKGPADGYTLLALTGNDAILNPLALSSAKYRPEDLRLVHPLIFSDFVLVTAMERPPKGIDDLVAMARRPGAKELSFGNWGMGTLPHLAAADLRVQTGIATLDVPYKGGAPIIQDLLAHQLDFAFLPLAGSTLEMIRSGKLKAVAMATRARNPSLPEVPAAGESKLLKNFDYKVWPGIFVRKETPEPIVAMLHRHIAMIVNGGPYQQWSRETGNQPMVPMTLAEATAFYQAERQRNARVVAAMKLVPQ